MRIFCLVVLASCVERPTRFSDHVDDSARPFAPTYELWADGAEKQRWIQLPPGGVIDTADPDHWRMPVGTRLFKEFRVAGRRVETRMIEQLADGPRYATFVWTANEADAEFVTEGLANANGTTHDVPAISACPVCHASEPGGVLGFSAIQLSGDVPLSIDDLERANGVSVARGRRYPLPGNDTARRAFGTLHANCGHCHTDTGMMPAQQLRWYAADTDGALADAAPYRSTVDHPVTDWSDRPDGVDLRITPGDPAASAVYYRMSQRGTSAQMPPLATEEVDRRGVDAVRAMIQEL